MAVQGIKLLAKRLPQLVDISKGMTAVDGDEVRSDLLYAAWLCGTCLGSVGMGLHHKLCHTLGGMLNTPHAETHTIILPHAIQYNYDFIPGRVQQLLIEALGLSSSESVNAVKIAATLFDLQKQCGAPTSLSDYGVHVTQLSLVASSASSAAAYPNPAPLDQSRLLELLNNAYQGSRPMNTF